MPRRVSTASYDPRSASDTPGARPTRLGRARGTELTHLCMRTQGALCIESPIIGSVISNLELGSYCFDCAVMAGLAKGRGLPVGGEIRSVNGDERAT